MNKKAVRTVLENAHYEENDDGSWQAGGGDYALPDLNAALDDFLDILAVYQVTLTDLYAMWDRKKEGDEDFIPARQLPPSEKEVEVDWFTKIDGQMVPITKVTVCDDGWGNVHIKDPWVDGAPRDMEWLMEHTDEGDDECLIVREQA